MLGFNLTEHVLRSRYYVYHTVVTVACKKSLSDIFKILAIGSKTSINIVI
jgi:hypothetical protein